jgi:hypothetical protein
MRDHDGIESAISERPKIWQGIFALLLRMHAAVEDKPLTRSLDVIAIGADLGATREVNELQNRREIAPSPNKSKHQFQQWCDALLQEASFAHVSGANGASSFQPEASPQGYIQVMATPERFRGSKRDSLRLLLRA